ncbi:PIN domain nuclease of toxin-antitoxin system [Silvibacterium bohemicum]|uniref:PIN domain nuclease of toxin-antitoxin system n=1 Tax=Silvibacterium bohemicum TaxID=1577686 RepID=A0A841JVS2_9BACT|nr:PIN domain-containing protein [Silvibacterium bohemicum]MBB6145493.1 PIN domain nuclease of toxin-antitoxin system [Silvibacterium bohemicum]
MTTYVLDASALLRYLDQEPGSDRVRELLDSYANAQIKIVISAVQWGEIACKLFQCYDRARYEYMMSGLYGLGLLIEPASPERAVRAAIIKATTKIAYADAFCVELALDSPQDTVVTADFGFSPAAHLVNIEFLPTK